MANNGVSSNTGVAATSGLADVAYFPVVAGEQPQAVLEDAAGQGGGGHQADRQVELFTAHAGGWIGGAEPRIDLVRLDEGTPIERLDGGVYALAEEHELTVAPAGEEGMGYLVQGSLERSNVDLNAEMVGLLVAQRAYAANAQVVRAADEFLSLANGLRR